MAAIDPREVQKRFDRLTSILGDIASHADSQAAERCPYRDRHDQCTAKFHCRNQTPTEASDMQHCGHDGRFDYRSAWETDPAAVERARQKLKKTREKRKDDV
ncbi:MAG: hypothetical protein HOM68_26335 [Gemmatimonadetes bacterium]|jgi:hypothetical protein|nr:hypothetical protein [Gemmatimonadota bacterium]MBT5144245.1 hypothetical protein [Gemmatimonadota bacterium]MBT5588729.1 hypothetical protein [Gemmatimonadota bacterium]MBT5964553.1 hypothetical protein [Gemmatimonadota bacterium]MBT6629008.1 hypothetical protein [Gemmatimonadota bacterium]